MMNDAFEGDIVYDDDRAGNGAYGEDGTLNDDDGDNVNCNADDRFTENDGGGRLVVNRR